MGKVLRGRWGWRSVLSLGSGRMLETKAFTVGHSVCHKQWQDRAALLMVQCDRLTSQVCNFSITLGGPCYSGIAQLQSLWRQCYQSSCTVVQEEYRAVVTSCGLTSCLRGTRAIQKLNIFLKIKLEIFNSMKRKRTNISD